MIRTGVKIIMNIGKATFFGFGFLVVLALLLGPVGVGLAAVGDPLLLGKSNPVDKLTTLTGNVSGGVMRIVNQGSGAGLDVRVEAGNPPLKVNSRAKVANLNADTLDGQDASELGQMWAVVDDHCTLKRGSGAVKTKGSMSETFCGVEFERDVDKCAFVAGLSEPDGYPGGDGRGEVWAYSGDPPGDSSTIYVRTAASNGDDKQGKSFHVVVFC